MPLPPRGLIRGNTNMSLPRWMIVGKLVECDFFVYFIFYFKLFLTFCFDFSAVSCVTFTSFFFSFLFIISGVMLRHALLTYYIHINIFTAVVFVNIPIIMLNKIGC